METVQQAGEPKVRFESVLSELLSRVDDDALVGRVQDAWAALLGSKRASEPTPDDLEWIADNIVAFGDFAKEAELLRNRAALDRALTSRLQAGEPADLCARITAYLSSGGLFNPEMARHDAVRDLLIDCRETLHDLLASRPQQPQAETPLTEPGPLPSLPEPTPEVGLPVLSNGKVYGFTDSQMRAYARAALAHPNTGAHPPEAEPKQSRVLYADEPLSEQSYTPLPLSPEAQETKPQIS